MGRSPLFQNISIPEGLKAQIKYNIQYLTVEDKKEIVNYFIQYDENFKLYYLNSLKDNGLMLIEAKYFSLKYKPMLTQPDISTNNIIII